MKGSSSLNTFALARRLFSESVVKAHSRSLAFAVLCMIILALATAASAWILRHVVNDVLSGQDISKIWALGVSIAAIYIVKGFAGFGQNIVLDRIGNAVQTGFYIRSIEQLAALPVNAFSGQHSSNFVTRISRGAQAARETTDLICTRLGRDLLTLIALFAVMLAQDPFLTFIAIATAPVALIFVTRIVQKVKAHDTAEFGHFSSVLAAMQETVQGIHIIKAYSLESTTRDRVSKAAREAEKRANAISVARASTGPLMESLGGIVLGVLVVYAGWQIMAAGKTAGEFMAFLAAFLLAYEPSRRLARLNVELQRNLNRLRPLYELLDWPRGDAGSGKKTLWHAKGDLSLDNVTFAYRAGHDVLRGVSFKAKPGEVIAIVGSSGAGKTTIINLIQRFYTPDSGTITIDGNDIQDLTVASVRQNISYVSQDAFLFAGSIRDNIACGRADATEAEIHAAAAAANATEFIEALPDGFQTVVGENGGMLSGGQRQRIAIARAILKGAPILLLDEATSALDSESDAIIRDAIGRLMRGRTTLVIAHRLSTVVSADRIYVIDKGRVIESGSHDILVRNEKLYSRLFESMNIFDDGPKAREIRSASAAGPSGARSE
ncbi:MAG: ABC transporter ATP-binding protein [Ahrensia sp.]|nr:ABC transporter ATP-binding protein [Ahrensia sp.]